MKKFEIKYYDRDTLKFSFVHLCDTEEEARAAAGAGNNHVKAERLEIKEITG